MFDFLISHLLALGPISGLYDIFSSEDFVSAQISYLFIGFEAVCVPYSWKSINLSKTLWSSLKREEWEKIIFSMLKRFGLFRMLKKRHLFLGCNSYLSKAYFSVLSPSFSKQKHWFLLKLALLINWGFGSLHLQKKIILPQFQITWLFQFSD